MYRNHFGVADGEPLTALDLSLGSLTSLQFTATVSASAFLASEEDKTSFLESLVATLQESEDGVFLTF